MMNIDHIGIVVKNIKDAQRQYESLLGFRQQTDVILDRAQKVYVQFFVNKKGERLELIEPIDTTSPAYNALKKGGGVNHICFRCSNIEEAVKRAQQQKCFLVCHPVIGAGHEGQLIAFVVHSDFGLIEFVEFKEK